MRDWYPDVISKRGQIAFKKWTKSFFNPYITKIWVFRKQLNCLRKVVVQHRNLHSWNKLLTLSFVPIVNKMWCVCPLTSHKHPGSLSWSIRVAIRIEARMPTFMFPINGSPLLLKLMVYYIQKSHCNHVRFFN